MSATLRILGVLLAVVMLAGCIPTMGGTVITGSGRGSTQEYDFSGFSKVNVSSALGRRFEQGDGYAVSVTIDDNLVEYLDVRVEGDTLHIGMKPRLSIGFGNFTQKAEITMPQIEGIASGATQGDVSGFESNRPLEIEVSAQAGCAGTSLRVRRGCRCLVRAPWRSTAAPVTWMSKPRAEQRARWMTLPPGMHGWRSAAPAMSP